MSNTISVSRTRTKPTSKKASAALDVIDQLDPTNALGFHHDGPFDAASSHRNRAGAARPAPIAAFDPAALSPLPPPDPSSLDPHREKRSGTGKLSPRAQTTLNAMEDSDAKFLSRAPRDSAYAALPSSVSPDHLYPPGRPRCNSDSSVASINLGYPENRSGDSKARPLAEVFGIQESEAWEDFARPAVSRQRSDNWTSKDLRTQRAASVWDMEATLRAGKPVGSLPLVPSLPGPSVLAQSTNAPDRTFEVDPNGPKRSKSLMQRIKKARRDVNVPIPPADSHRPQISSPILQSNSITNVRDDTSDAQFDYRASVTGDVLAKLALDYDEDEKVNFDDEDIIINTGEGEGLGRKTTLMNKVKGLGRGQTNTR